MTPMFTLSSSSMLIPGQTSVKTIRERPDFSRSGQWEVVTEGGGGQEEKHVFDAVICCSGHYTYPNLPLKDFPGDAT